MQAPLQALVSKELAAVNAQLARLGKAPILQSRSPYPGTHGQDSRIQMYDTIHTDW